MSIPIFTTRFPSLINQTHFNSLTSLLNPMADAAVTLKAAKKAQGRRKPMQAAPSPKKVLPQVATMTSLQMLVLRFARRYLLNCSARCSVTRGSPFVHSSRNLEWSCCFGILCRCVFPRTLTLLHALFPTLMFALLSPTLMAVLASLHRVNGAHLHEWRGRSGPER